MTEPKSRFARQFAFLLSCYVIGVAAMSILLLNPALKSPTLVSTLPLLPGFIIMLVMLSMWARFDELERKIISSAATFALVTTIAMGLVLEVLHPHTALPLLSATQLLTLATAFWAIAGLIGWRRFQG